MGRGGAAVFLRSAESGYKHGEGYVAPEAGFPHSAAQGGDGECALGSLLLGLDHRNNI